MAIDYDGTYSSDPDYWDAVIALAGRRGHRFICVTNRAWVPGSQVPERVPAVPLLAAGDQYKADAAKAAGYAVDIWIDDLPGTVGPILDLP